MDDLAQVGSHAISGVRALVPRHRLRVLVQRHRLRRASNVLAVAAGAPVVPTWVGVEHEFLVFDESGGRADFRALIHGLRLGRRDLVPGDRNAYRLPTGSVVTADTTEAEIATPPTTLRAGFARQLDGWLAYERGALAARLAGLGVSLRGDSTHLNVSLPADLDADRVADLFATRFAAGLMLLLDRSTSPGLLVRPRPMRLELGGEYAVGDTLRAALAYAVGGTLACVAHVRGSRDAGLPPALAARLERGALRYGWYVDRAAFGVDLYAAGRNASLVTTEGLVTTAQEQLERSWSTARAAVAPHVGAHDLRAADEIVSRAGRLPTERPVAEQEADVAAPRRPRSAFGSALRAIRRPGFDAAPVMLSWSAGVWLVAQRERCRAAFVAVPGADLEPFMALLRGGALDMAVMDYLAMPPAGRRLASPTSVAKPGMYDEMGLRSGLLPTERDQSGRPLRPIRTRHSLPADAALASA